ncbi:MAG TPA: hypothetical protein VFE35_02730 [Candidatus Cybelea sp.]|jgi:hypothetical protein|nr:hypothetical protein [Candidatus Cybelea sp.]
MKGLLAILAATIGIVAFGAVASAQGAPPPPGAPPPEAAPPPAPPPYVDTTCGSWQGDTWVPNGNCPTTMYKHQVVAGTIISVKGHLVTVQQTGGTVVIDDSAALSNQASGRVAVGRQIVAHGYWQASNFYATAITGGQPPP